MLCTIQRELPDREGCWLAGKQLVGRDGLKAEELGDDKVVGQAADTAGYILVGTDHLEVAGKDKHYFELADSGDHALQAA